MQKTTTSPPYSNIASLFEVKRTDIERLEKLISEIMVGQARVVGRSFVGRE